MRPAHGSRSWGGLGGIDSSQLYPALLGHRGAAIRADVRDILEAVAHKRSATAAAPQARDATASCRQPCKEASLMLEIGRDFGLA